MKVLSIEDQEDGSAIVELEMSQKENNFFVEYAVIDILRKQIERMDYEHGKVQSDEASESEDN